MSAQGWSQKCYEMYSTPALFWSYCGQSRAWKGASIYRITTLSELPFSLVTDFVNI